MLVEGDADRLEFPGRHRPGDVDADDLDAHDVANKMELLEVARRYTGGKPASILSFGIKGGQAAGARFIDALQLFYHVANIGDAKTLIIHPASTTHAQLTEQQLADSGIGPGLVRLSVGIEDVDDIIYDLDQALAIATGEVRA